MERPEAATLLHAWERGAAQGPTIRGLLLLGAASPGATPAALAATGIGARDARLLELREALFGAELECIASCPHCEERVEISFPTRGIRATHHDGDEPLRTAAHGYQVEFRLPSSADLLAREEMSDASAAECALLARCVLQASSADGECCDAGTLPTQVIEAIDRRMGELDSQAQIELDLSCPMCMRQARATFDIVTHLWSELETWARAQLREVHTIAASYGWSEAQILALSPARRRAYLQLLGAAE